MMKFSASDAAYSLERTFHFTGNRACHETTRDESTSTYADNDIAYSCFHLFPLYFSCGPYILKKNKQETYFVLNRLFLKVGA